MPLALTRMQVINRGPSVISGASLDIFWPSFIDNGKHLLYLIDKPFVSDKARCTVKQAANQNPAGLAVSARASNAHHASSIAMQVSGQHLSTPETHTEVEEVETSAGGGRAYDQTVADHDADDEEDFADDRHAYDTEDEAEYLRSRHRRDTKHRRQLPDSVRRKLREQRVEMKEAMRLSKEAGGAVEYRGSLNKAELVSARIVTSAARLGGVCNSCARLQNCNSLNCTQISCVISELLPEQFVLVEVYSRLWLNTIVDSDHLDMEDVGSLAFAQVTSLPFAPEYKPPPQALAIYTKINAINSEQSTSVPWWLILLAILIALLILALIIYCCYRVSQRLVGVATSSHKTSNFSAASSNAIAHSTRRPSSTRASLSTTTRRHTLCVCMRVVPSAAATTPSAKLPFFNPCHQLPYRRSAHWCLARVDYAPTSRLGRYAIYGCFIRFTP